MSLVPWGEIVRDFIAGERHIAQHAALWSNNNGRLFVPSIRQPVVDCQQFQQLITSAVDQRLCKEELEAFVDHAAKCNTCRYEYEAESAVKTLVRSHLKMVPTPPALRESVSSRIHLVNCDHAPTMSSQPPARSVALSVVRPVLGGGLVLVAVMAFMFWPFGIGPAPRTPLSSDVQTESVANFHAVLAGVMQPQVVSDLPDQVREFLSDKTDFPAQVPALKKCTLVGASANEYHGMKLAHVVYTHAGQLIYMFQAPYDRVLAGDGLAISDEAREHLASAASFASVAPGGDTVIFWVLGNTLCVAVSKIDPKELSDTLLE